MVDQSAATTLESREGRAMFKRMSWHVHSVLGGCYDRRGPPSRPRSASMQPQRHGHFKTLNLLCFFTTIKKQNYIQNIFEKYIFGNT